MGSRLCCIHEAGHAVVAVRLGIKFKSVSVVPRGKTGGRVRAELSGARVLQFRYDCGVYRLGPSRATRRTIHREVVFTLAGMAAELFVGQGERVTVLDHGLGDRELANALIHETATSQQDGRDQWLQAWNEAVALVVENNHAILAVSDTLGRVQRISFPRVRRIVEGTDNGN